MQPGASISACSQLLLMLLVQGPHFETWMGLRNQASDSSCATTAHDHGHVTVVSFHCFLSKMRPFLLTHRVSEGMTGDHSDRHPCLKAHQAHALVRTLLLNSQSGPSRKGPVSLPLTAKSQRHVTHRQPGRWPPTSCLLVVTSLTWSFLLAYGMD